DYYCMIWHINAYIF
nr:immunoglobulin light chain junction region [Macaca mulatta]MOW36321.1 immunoglobulin light chain junction region [Macaca mulatta]MOW36507.1 immunoglobulin light chain junction region [Macaca mulatta]MOW36934.1 immunoglobulin light chain junction region [Macaca mulatta]MOW37030.1 immunoglobulin light chain junction region [Macaca mulatta]